MPNGAQALMKTLVDAGVEVCFTNPGTSEMHFVAALDSETRMRAVLCLFEGVATGAADGYARMAGKPAAVLVSAGDYERLVRRNSSFSEFMRRSPLYQSEMELVRDKTAAREVEL